MSDVIKKIGSGVLSGIEIELRSRACKAPDSGRIPRIAVLRDRPFWGSGAREMGFG